MSGHSHAKTVKRVKEAGDKKRSQIFSKMARAIWIAAKEGGPNPETNSKLRLVIDLARSANMPKENIKRAIERASGEIPGEKLEEIIFEAFGPGGVVIIIEVITDNRNRSLGQIKQILNQNGGKLAGEGSVKWMFERKGHVIIKKSGLKNEATEDLEIAAIEAGAEDTYWQDEILNIYTKPDSLEETKKNLKEKNIEIDSISLGWVAKEEIPIDEKIEKACQKLFEALDEDESVQEIYSNIKI